MAQALAVKKTSRVFYGYYMIAVCFALLFMSAGCGFYPFSLFVKPLQSAFGWSRAEIMTASLTWTITHGIGSFLVGRLMDRYGPRKVIVLGVLISGIGTALLATMKSLWQFYIFYGISGLGFPSTGPIPVSSLIFNWFKRKKGLAIGIAGTGVGAGGLVMSLFVGGYLIPVLGWQMTFLFLGLIMIVVIIPLTLLIVRTRPEDMGLLPDGAQASPEKTASKAKVNRISAGINLSQAFKTQAFWCVAAASLTIGFSAMGVNRNQTPHLQDIGFSAAAAASVLGVVGIGNGAGKFIFGFISDWVKPKYSLLIAIAFQMASLAILMAASSETPVAVIWLYAVMSGFGMGSWLPIMSMLVTTNFGALAYGSIFGMINLINMIGGSVGPLLAGYVYDVRQSYTVAFTAFLFVYGAAMIATFLIRRPKSAEGYEGAGDKTGH